MASHPLMPDHDQPAAAIALAARQLEVALRAAHRDITRLRAAVRELQHHGDTRLLACLADGLAMAERRGLTGLADLAGDRPGAAISACIELCDLLRTAVFSRDNCDDLDRELHDPNARAALWTRVETGSEALQAACTRLADAVSAYSLILDARRQ